MEISAALAADLALLTAALDEPGADIAEAVRQLGISVGVAVPSYLGLTVFATEVEPTFTLSVLADGADQRDIRASLMMPLSGIPRTAGVADVGIVLYAGAAGAFVDLAADLAWILGLRLGDVVVDEHLIVAGLDTAGSAALLSIINQALGVLLGRGMTPEEADDELDAQAAAAGTDRHTAATQILRELTDPADESGG